jgi:hypothetical protein
MSTILRGTGLLSGILLRHEKLDSVHLTPYMTKNGKIISLEPEVVSSTQHV